MCEEAKIRVFQGATSEGLTCEYRLLTAADLATCAGAWLLSSVRGVAPVLDLDGMPVAHDEAMTRRIRGWVGW